MRWSILTPELSIHWDGDALTAGPGATRRDAPAQDPVEDIWKGYSAALFTPARLKAGAMLSAMPRKYWRNLPDRSEEHTSDLQSLLPTSYACFSLKTKNSRPHAYNHVTK